MDRKKIIILILIIVVILFVGGYWYFSKHQEEIKNIPGLSGLFPSGGSGNIDSISPGNGDNLPPSGNGATNINSLIALTNDSVSGAAWSSTTVRYVETATGNIYEISPDGQNKKRITNTTILKSFDSLWSKGGSKILLKYFDDTNNSYLEIKNFLASIKIATSSELSSLTGIFLPLDMTEAAISPFEDKIFYLLKTSSGTNGVTADLNNKKQINVFSSSFGDFLVDWPIKEKVTLLSKPSGEAEGFFYTLDLKTKKLSRILGNVFGLTALMSPDGSKIIFSENINNKITTRTLNIKDSTEENFELTTLAEKCVWSKTNKNIIYCAIPKEIPLGVYPDIWYQGLVSFNDSIWQKDFTTGQTKILYQETGSDVIKPILNLDESYLVFINKKDNTLWSIKLK
jgi:hypothetical protein